MPAQKHQSQSVSDPVAHALNRVFNHAVSNGKSAEAYLCSLRIPSMFSNAPKTANTIYKKTMSDYCKGVMRLPDGETPRYVAVASEQNGFPLYKFCLFAKPGLDLNAEDGVEHGRYIANSKVSEFGFGNGTLDVVQLFLQAPRFSVSEPIAVNEANKADVMDRLQAHLRDKSSGAGDGRLKRMKYLIHDNDPLFKGRFDQYVEGAGCKIKRLPPRSPELNGFMESFIKTIKTECLNHFILTSVEQLRYVVSEYLEYYNHERPHSGLGRRDDKAVAAGRGRRGGHVHASRRFPEIIPPREEKGGIGTFAIVPRT